MVGPIGKLGSQLPIQEPQQRRPHEQEDAEEQEKRDEATVSKTSRALLEQQYPKAASPTSVKPPTRVGPRPIARELERRPVTQESEPQQQAPAEEERRWSGYCDAMFDWTDQALDMWKLVAGFENITIMAVSATGLPGCLVGPELNTWPPSTAAGVPEGIASAFANGISRQFKTWQDMVTVPGLPWYPSFAAFPAPFAPPTPNIPMPLVSCASSGLSALSTPRGIKDAILAELGDAVTPAAEVALDDFATRISLKFLTWVSSQQIEDVMGLGQVPGFAPPYAPTGPVVAGWVLANRPFLT